MCTQPNEPMYRVEWRASRLGARMPTTQKAKKVGRWHRGGDASAPLSLFHLASLCLVVDRAYCCVRTSACCAGTTR
jgi:hypothetical protein